MNSFICQLADLSLVTLEGEKSADFLQGQITCDVREINALQTRRGAHCSPKGRVLSTFRVVQFQQGYYLLTPTLMSLLLIEQLKKYAIFSKVILRQDDSLQVIGCMGSQIAEYIAALFGPLPEQPDQALVYAKAGENGTENLLLIRVQGTVPRFKIIGCSATIRWLWQLLSAIYPVTSTDQWRLENIELGIPAIYPETRDLFTPQMLNYPALYGVSFKKGCYTGQEVIARTHYLGKAKRHLQRLSLKSPFLAKPGDTLYDSTQLAVAIVVDAAVQRLGECQLLAVIQDEALLKALYWQQPDNQQVTCILEQN